jgi:hypothetical protein
MRRYPSVLAAMVGVLLAGCESMPGQSASTAGAAPSQLSGYTC